MGFLRFVLIFILVTMLLRLIGRFFFMRFMKNWQNKMSGQFNQETPKPKGEVTIDDKAVNKSSSASKNKTGDYVDYEEIK